MAERNETFPPIGIDLGTTFSCVATLDAKGRPYTIQNAEGDSITPSVVMFDDKNVIVGKEAVKLSAHEPDAVAQYVKRDIGARRIGKAVRGTHLPPEVVESLVLQKLKADAELKVGSFESAVITVPAYFNESRRKATQDAGRLAGIDVLDIINEPTAAAIAFGVERGFLSGEGEAAEAETVMVYDLGGGTFDATLMRLEGHDYTALATAGDVYLGGIDWDRRLADFVADLFQEKHEGIDLRLDAAAWHRLCADAEDAKRTLTVRDEVNFAFEYDGRRLRTVVTREHFESVTVDLLERTRFTLRRLLKDGGLQWEDVTRLLLVGGSTRMPMIQEMLTDESGIVPDRSLAADEAVAHGAAIYAGYLMAGNKDAVHASSVGTITNVNSHDLGVLAIEGATGRPRRKILIARNTPLPSRRAARFVTQMESQITVNVNVVEGGDDSGHNATPVGICQVTDLPPGLPAKSTVVVEFKYQENGRLTVRAHVPDVGRAATMQIQRESGMSDEELETWTRLIAEGNLIKHVETAEEVEPAELVQESEDESSLSSKFEDVELTRQVDDLDSGIGPPSDAVDAPPVQQEDDEEPSRSDEEDPDLNQFLKGLP